MMMMRLRVQCFFVALQVLANAVADDFDSQCKAFASKLGGLANTTIYATEYLPAGSTYQAPGMESTCNLMGPKQPTRADLCRITAYAATSNRSGIHFEAWLPRSWSGRFISHGNGGLSGCEKSPSNESQPFF
jgi:feruloyl esterase